MKIILNNKLQSPLLRSSLDLRSQRTGGLSSYFAVYLLQTSLKQRIKAANLTKLQGAPVPLPGQLWGALSCRVFSLVTSFFVVSKIQHRTEVNTYKIKGFNLNINKINKVNSQSWDCETDHEIKFQCGFPEF